ncbi:MAG: NHL repeat-containing protein [Candidatus Fermentibacteria bacterium]|nr:NHL repeat-containing protein [Candidatus Fermentibacteria bacterium]
MAVQLDCPSCGASVKARRGVASVICQYCGNSVMVPEHLADSSGTSKSYNLPGRSCGKVVLVFVAVLILLLIGVAVFVYAMVDGAKDGVVELSALVSEPYLPASNRELVFMEFGGSGTGPGYFTDPQAITVDSQGNIYIGERETSRIQVFDKNGNFVTQWFFPGGEDTFLRAMSCDSHGTMYMAYNNQLYIHCAETGELLDSLRHPDGWGFSDVDVAPDGRVVASWYCTRDDIICFDNSGAVELVIEEAISRQSGEPELNTTVIAGNLGEIYAFGSFNEAVFVFNSEGRFVNRFGNAEQFTMPSGFDVDPYGRLWVSDFEDLLLFDPGGELLMTIDPGVIVKDFVISNDMQLYGITSHDIVVQIDISTY